MVSPTTNPLNPSYQDGPVIELGGYQTPWTYTGPPLDGVYLYYVTIPNNTDNTSQDYISNYAVIYSHTFIVFFSIFINISFMLILTCGMQSYKRPFYRIVWQLIIANLFKSISSAATTIPAIFFSQPGQSEAYTTSFLYKILNYFDVAGDQLIVWITLLIAISRLCVFVFPEVSDKVFTGKTLNLLIFLNWLFGITISLMLTLNGCNYKFFPGTGNLIVPGSFRFTCIIILNKIHWRLIEWAIIGQAVLFPLLGLICYLRLFVEIARRRNGWKNTKSTEVEILKQALVLFVAFELSIAISFISIIFTSTALNAFLVRRIVNSVELLAGIVTPLFFIITSKEIREGASRLNPLRVNIRVSFSSKKVTHLKSIPSSQSGTHSIRTRTNIHSLP